MHTACYDLSNAEIKKANLEEPVFISGSDFRKALKTLDVFPGIRMVVHTRFSSLGKFENGPENFCAILKRMVTEDGLLMMPGLVRYPNDGEDYLFDPEQTPVNVGIVAETFRKQPGTLRSWDPTHSFCVWGKNKEYFIQNHHKLPTMHRNSPLGLLEQADGYCLLVGCQEAATFMHVVETTNGAPCLGSRTEEYPAIIHGQRVKLRSWGWRNGNCKALNHHKLYDFMREQRTLSEMMLGRSHLLFFKLRDYRTAYTRLLDDPETGCAVCSLAPRSVKQSIPSDWDMEHDTLKTTNAFVVDFS